MDKLDLHAKIKNLTKKKLITYNQTNKLFINYEKVQFRYIRSYKNMLNLFSYLRNLLNLSFINVEVKEKKGNYVLYITVMDIKNPIIKVILLNHTFIVVKYPDISLPIKDNNKNELFTNPKKYLLENINVIEEKINKFFEPYLKGEKVNDDIVNEFNDFFKKY